MKKLLLLAALTFPMVGKSEGAAFQSLENAKAAAEKAHAEIWRRFVDEHNVVLDYTDLDGKFIRPTPEDCRAHKPSALSWGVPVEDGPMFNGLYLDGLCTRWRVTGDEAIRAKARRLTEGLLFLASLGHTPGFIARGVATDGKTTYPMGSNDQTTPWLYGLWRYVQDGLATPAERAKLVKRFCEVVAVLDQNGWNMPCDGGPSKYRGGFARFTWEGAPRLVFVLKAMHQFTGEARWAQRYREALQERGGKEQRSRLDICRTGMVFDPGQGARHSWTGSEGVICLRALWEMETDPELRAAYAQGLRASAELSARSLPLCQQFEVNGTEHFEHNWRLMNEAWQPQNSEAETVAVANAGLRVQHRVSPRMHLEKDWMREPCFAAWVVALCPDAAFVAQHRAAISAVITHYRYDRLYLSQFFPVESAWWRLVMLDGTLVGRKPVILNQAADAVVNYLKLEKPLGKGATREMVEAAMPLLVDQYQGLGVTHIFWNVNYQRVGYRSAVWPSYWDVEDPAQIKSWPRSYHELHQLGIDDIFGVVIPHCRERGISPWVSLRMNDHHYTSDPTCVSDLFRTHPELRTNKGKGLWDYTRPEVREFYLKLLVEVLQRYDVDGIELDWVRTPPRFEPAERERGRACLTEFVRAARRETTAAAERRGHPVRLAVRVPDTPEFALGMGFDAAGWGREGLIDMIIPHGWWNGFEDIPIEDWRAALGPAAGKCQVVPGTACTYACTKKGFMMERNLAAMRGFVAAMFDRGADGLYLFNHFAPVYFNIKARTPEGKAFNECTQGDLLRAAGDPAGAVAAPRVHALAIHDQIPDKSDHQPPLPFALTQEQVRCFRLHTGPKPATGRYVLRIGLDQSADLAAAKLAVKLNGSACRALADMPVPAKPEPRLELPRQHTCEVAPRLLQFEAPLAAVARGYNMIEVQLTQGGPQTLIWLEALLEP